MSAAEEVVGFVGLGAMGSRIAGRLLATGRRVVVFDARAQAADDLVAGGATRAGSAREVADAAATVLVSLPTPQIVRTVALGDDGLAGGAAIRTYVDLSTTGPAMAEEVARGLGEHSIACVDAPVSGGPAGADAGRLTLMVAGPAAAVADVRPLLEAFAGKLFVVGEVPGQGQTTKVINNLLSACAIAITGEAVVLGVRAGLDPKTLLDVIDASSGQSNAASDKFPKQVLTREFDHGFRLALMAKDVRLALDEARRRQVPMLLGSTVSELWNLADAQDDGADCTAIVQLFEQWGGATIETAP
jgi:2-hydroxy-3-oxopropionate reductase